jgi:hypothetical protein
LLFTRACAVLVRLPFGGHDHAAGGIVIGAGEAVDLPGALSRVAEVVALVIAVVLVDRQDAIRLDR